VSWLPPTALTLTSTLRFRDLRLTPVPAVRRKLAQGVTASAGRQKQSDANVPALAQFGMSLFGPSAKFLALAKKRLVIGVVRTRLLTLSFSLDAESARGISPRAAPSRSREFHPQSLTESGLEPLDSTCSCHHLRNRALHQGQRSMHRTKAGYMTAPDPLAETPKSSCRRGAVLRSTLSMKRPPEFTLLRSARLQSTWAAASVCGAIRSARTNE
jgi:hypothetical protein